LKLLRAAGLALLLIAAAPAVQPLLNGTLAQGGVVRAQLPAGSQAVTLDGKPVAIDRNGRFPIGFGRDAGPTAMLHWRDAAGIEHDWPITVAARQWKVQALPNLPPRPVPDAEFERRRPAELARIAAARADLSDRSDWQDEFYAPVDGPVTGVFGSQRILSGQPQAPHAGIDFAAATGTPVKAPAGGIVRLAEGPFTLEGNLVMIDHGAGLVSAFLHLSRIDVKVGDVVAEGQVIGAVGKTGRATGPHLHWSLSWTDVRVDPASVLVQRNPFE
jgi:murein DD-endopeptidase MepM/ murein hydrolase activator NlpD